MDEEATRRLDARKGSRTPGPAIPPSIGGYRIIGLLGAGGMGVVYDAEQAKPQRPVALKVIRQVHGTDSGNAGMFQREIEALGRLKHPAIATIYEAGRTPEGQDYLAMERVQGASLLEWISSRPALGGEAELRLRLRLFQAVCEGVNYAHLRGIVHRDLKPANIMVLDPDRPGDLPAVKILDFGLARLLEDGSLDPAGATEPGMLVGTLAYMSPEQARGERGALDVRTDVYSLGVILYELLFQRRPYDLEGLPILDCIRTICEQPPAPWSESWNGVPRPDPDLWTILETGLAKEPDLRYPSVGMLGEEVGRFLGAQPLLARPSSRTRKARLFLRRYRTGVAVASLLFLMVAAFGVVMGLQARRIRREASINQDIRGFLEGMFDVWNPENAQGKTFSAKEVLLRAQGRLGAVRDPEVRSRLMATLGALYLRLGMPKEAQGLFAEALEHRRRDRGPDHPDTLVALNNLGNALDDQGQHAEAEKIYRQTSQARARRLGTDHEATLSSENDLANALFALGRLEEAATLHARVLKAREGTLGPAHPDTLSSRYNLAGVCFAQGRLEEAEPLCTRTLESRLRILGPDHPDTLSSRNQLGNLRYKQGRFQEAERLYEEVLEAKRRVLGEEHPNTLRAMMNLAGAMDDGGRPEAAAELLRATLEKLNRVLGPEHPLTLSGKFNLAYTLRGLRRLGEARALYLEAWEAKCRVVGEDHPGTIATLVELAEVEHLLGRDAEALARLEQVPRTPNGRQALREIPGKPEWKGLAQNPRFLAVVSH